MVIGLNGTPYSRWGQSTGPIPKTSLLLRLHAGTIHESNPEDLLVFKAPQRDDLEQNAGTIDTSNRERYNSFFCAFELKGILVTQLNCYWRIFYF